MPNDGFRASAQRLRVDHSLRTTELPGRIVPDDPLARTSRSRRRKAEGGRWKKQKEAKGRRKMREHERGSVAVVLGRSAKLRRAIGDGSKT
jgi:hypothetical protein